ncbi:MAG: response regulator [Lacisediminihabitans sp.]
MSDGIVRVLVVDDEPVMAAAHAEYIARIDGFEVVGIAHSGREALRCLRDSTIDGSDSIGAIDLILLDINLPDANGIELCRRIRAAGLHTDVIAITAVRDVKTVRAAVSLGVVQYLIKPFTFATFADKMHGYLGFRQRIADTADLATQDDVDRSLAALRTRSSESTRAQLDKGLTEETLDRVMSHLRMSDSPHSATEVGSSTGISRVTARRYLEYLADEGVIERSLRYGARGRPELEYRRNVTHSATSDIQPTE